MASQLSTQLNVPPINDGVPSKGSNSTLLQPCPPPRPPGLPKLRPDARSHPFNTPIPGDGQRRTPIIINHRQLLCIAIALLTLVLLFVYDPLASIIDVESAKQRASIQNATLLFEREKTEREREVIEREKELWEEAREAHVPRGAFWDVVWPAWDCLAYGKREYWGTLRNIPKDWDPVDACMDMPVEIKGVKIRRPKWCEGHYDLLHSQARGHWVVDWDQPDCKPWYHDFEDRGCSGYNSGKRRIEAQIVGINDKGGQDWRLLCNSTPLVWHMITYPSPIRCEERLWGKKFAIWEIPDESCLS